ncbi:unnamed protein product [Durusdinium trenchii]|uniref:G-patch domain-containing protein n=1 Tax=Durusdinium trenchii TaxID=1381693 RepID=A0ABP0KP49_9DINO
MGSFRALQEVFPQGTPPFSSPLPPASFRLEWGQTGHCISLARQVTLKEGIAEEVHVHHIAQAQGACQGLVRWLFLSISHVPNQEARQAYERHAKREQVGEEEVSLFFALDSEGSPEPVPLAHDGSRGSMHAVLPTELRTTVGGHMQASWLLSVDRQRMQDFADNAWNRALLMTLPRLLQIHLRWVAHVRPANLAKAYDILPDMEASKAGALTSKVLNQDMTWDALQSSIKTEALVPALKPDGQVHFLRAQASPVWVPPSFVELLPADFLTTWLGSAPIAATHIGSAVWHPLWFSLRHIDSRMLEFRKKSLENALRQQRLPAAIAVKLLAALGMWASPSECMGASAATPARPSRPGAVPTAQGAGARDGREAWLARLPLMQTWPVFWTARHEVVAASSVHWPDESWSQLSPAVRDILEGSLTGERRQALHADLLPLTTVPTGLPFSPATAPAPEIEGTTEREVRAARACLQVAKRQVPQTAITVQDAIARKMQQWQVESAQSVKGLATSTAQQVVTLSQWAMETSNWTVITHVLAGDASALRLLPVAEVLIRSEDLAGLEKLSGVGLPYVSALYTETSPQDAPKWEAFWQKCGLRSTFSFVASVSELQSFEHSWLPGNQVPARRTSKKDGELPYGLGKLHHTALKVVDVAFTPEWSKVITQLSQAQPPQDPEQEEQWRQDAMCLARLVSKLHIEVDSAGVAPADVPASELPAPKVGQGSKTLPPQKSPPSHRSLYFMPPGQPGEKRLALYPAQWLRQLTTSRWVPAKEVGGAAKRGWFKPCEVLLKADSTRPGLPVAELPPDILRHLEAFKKLFAWGTVAPEPPVERLAAVGAAAAKKAASEAPEPLWRAVAHAHRGGNLKPEQRSKLKNLAFFPVFPSPPSLLDRADRLSAARLVAPRTGASQEESEEVKALIDAKWLVDVHSPDWPLRDVAEDILALVDVAPRPSHASVGAFVSFCSTAEPCFTEELRGALTHALASLAQEAKKLKLKPPQAMQQIIPHLKLYCKEGPGLGKGRFPARWLPAYAPGPNGVVPVLNDDNTKAAMLTPAQNLQLLGMLDHPKSRFPSAARLEAKDDAAIEALGILRLSDPRVKLQTRITGAAELVAGSVERIDVVLTLLWRSGGQELPADHMKVCLRKCDSIARELTLGHTNEKAACLEAFAIWGEQDVEKNRCDLLVAGDADDYAAEVEELFEARFETLFRSCETRPAKVLRLLRHLESDKDFNKFLARDFAGVLEQQELERRKAEARAALAAQLAKKQAQDQLEQQQRQQRAEQQAFAEALRQEEKARQAEMEEFVQAATAAKAQASSAELGMASAAKAPTPATPVLSLATQHLANAFTAGANSKDEAEEAKPQVMTVPAVPPMVVPAKAGLQPVGPLSRQQEPTPAGASSASSVVPAKAGLQPVGPLSRQQEPTPAGASSASSAPSAAQPGAVQPEVKRGGIYPLPNVAKPRVEPEAGPSASASAVPPRMSPASSEVEEPPTKKLKLSEAENNGDREDQPAENGQTDVTSDAKDATDLKVKEDDGHSALSSLQEELGKLRRENEALRTRAGQTATLFPVLGGHKEELDEKSELKTVATKGEIKRMKIEAKEVLYRPISEGFGFKMLQKMGWKEGEGLGKEEKGLATPLWVDPREGRSGLFSAQSGESRPPRSAEDEELPLAANPLRFVSEGGAVERISSNLRGLGFVSAQSSAGCGASMANGSPAGSSTGNMMHFQRATAPRPSVASVAPALFGLMADERWQNRSGGAAMLGELLAEALDPSAAERFLRLVDERLGPQVASHLSQTYGRPGQQDYVLQPLWQLST